MVCRFVLFNHERSSVSHLLSHILFHRRDAASNRSLILANRTVESTVGAASAANFSRARETFAAEAAPTRDHTAHTVMRQSTLSSKKIPHTALTTLRQWNIPAVNATFIVITKPTDNTSASSAPLRLQNQSPTCLSHSTTTRRHAHRSSRRTSAAAVWYRRGRRTHTLPSVSAHYCKAD